MQFSINLHLLWLHLHFVDADGAADYDADEEYDDRSEGAYRHQVHGLLVHLQ